MLSLRLWGWGIGGKGDSPFISGVSMAGPSRAQALPDGQNARPASSS